MVLMNPMNDLQQRLQGWWNERVEEFFDHPWEERSRLNRIGAGIAALTFLTTREVLRDRAPMMAASLSFFTVLAVVPLVTVAASLMAAFGLLEVEGGALFDTLYQVFPDVASGIASYLGEVATESAQAVGGIGAITLLIIGLVLFNAIEETLTRIWRGAHDRSMIIKMLTFYAMITFGPVLIALSIVQTASAHFYLTQIGIDVSLVDQLLPVGYGLIAFTLLYKLVPNADVKWRTALVGGVYAAVAFELAKWGFNLYVNQLLLHTYDRVYGALALIPIGLIWVYVTWLVILIGAELAFAFQHLEDLMQGSVGKRSRNARPDDYYVGHPMVALEVLAPIVSAFEHRETPVTTAAIARVTRLPDDVVDRVVQIWEDEEVIRSVEGSKAEKCYVPASAPESMALDELVELFWVATPDGVRDGVGMVSREYLKESRAFFQTLTASDLVGDAEPDRSVDNAEEGLEATPADAVGA